MYMKFFFGFCCFRFIFPFILDGNNILQFSVSVENSIKNPQFSLAFNVTISDQNKTLLTYLQETCDTDSNLLNFSMTYFPTFGYYISGFNGVTEVSGELYWDLTEYAGSKKSDIGASKYIPKPGDRVIFNLTDLQAYPVVHLSPHLLALLVENN